MCFPSVRMLKWLPLCLFPLHLTHLRNINLITGVFRENFPVLQKGLLNCLTSPRLWHEIARSTAGTHSNAAGGRSLLLEMFYPVISHLKCCRQQRRKETPQRGGDKGWDIHLLKHLKWASWEYFPGIARGWLQELDKRGAGHGNLQCKNAKPD